MTDHEWPAVRPPGKPLTKGQVHVWCTSLDRPPVEPEVLQGVLTEAERAIAEGYRFAADRFRSASSRGLLRWLLGQYLGVQPREVRLTVGPHGKPELSAPHSTSDLRFNVSHCEDVVLYALARDLEVGVDVERIRPMPNAFDIAERFFAPAEIEALKAMPPHLQDEAFFVCWTRKEAYVKAHGKGLALPLDEFEVALDRGPTATQLRMPADPAEAAVWALRDLCPQPGFVGALAVKPHSLKLRCCRWL